MRKAAVVKRKSVIHENSDFQSSLKQWLPLSSACSRLSKKSCMDIILLHKGDLFKAFEWLESKIKIKRKKFFFLLLLLSGCDRGRRALSLLPLYRWENQSLKRASAFPGMVLPNNTSPNVWIWLCSYIVCLLLPSWPSHFHSLPLLSWLSKS